MEYPICDICGKSLRDWQGNVMVDADMYLQKDTVEDILIWCCNCAKTMEKRGMGRQYSRIWDLRWMHNHYVYVLNRVMGSFLTEKELRFSRSVLLKIMRYGTAIYPNGEDFHV
jgi:hypothetical protein